jgi:hypothetical protein
VVSSHIILAFSHAAFVVGIFAAANAGAANATTRPRVRIATRPFIVFPRIMFSASWRTVEHYGGGFAARCYRASRGRFPRVSRATRASPGSSRNLVLAQAFIPLISRNKSDLGVSSSHHVAPTSCRNSVMRSVSFFRERRSYCDLSTKKSAAPKPMRGMLVVCGKHGWCCGTPAVWQLPNAIAAKKVQ